MNEQRPLLTVEMTVSDWVPARPHQPRRGRTIAGGMLRASVIVLRVCWLVVVWALKLLGWFLIGIAIVLTFGLIAILI